VREVTALPDRLQLRSLLARRFRHSSSRVLRP